MKINHLKQNTHKSSVSFKAGVTSLYSDFDGTFMPHKYRHDVFCRNDKYPLRADFLREGKSDFEKYFNSFFSFIKKARGKNNEKFNFTITTGRNRPEFNYFMERIRKDGLSVPTPEKLVTSNGGEIYTKRTDIEDFFKSTENEMFLSKDFLESKRSLVKDVSHGWDGEKFKGIIKNTLGSMKVRKKETLTVFEADTDGYFYKDGMHITDKLQTISPVPKNYVAIKDSGSLEYRLFFPENLATKEFLSKVQKKLHEQLSEQNNVEIFSKIKESNNGKYGYVLLAPKINNEKLNKVFDTKVEVEKIIKNKLNDLVIVAGDDSNDTKMLSFFEYIKNGERRIFNEKTLKQIYKLPLISIFVDNSFDKFRINKKGPFFEELDNYFNSDGNVRFIHVIPDNNIGKPKTLQEAILVAIKEYSKRNNTFRKNLPKEIQSLIENFNYEYPIDKSVSEQLELECESKLWNPSPDFKTVVRNSKIKKFSAIIGMIVGAVGLGFYGFNKAKEK